MLARHDDASLDIGDQLDLDLDNLDYERRNYEWRNDEIMMCEIFDAMRMGHFVNWNASHDEQRVFGSETFRGHQNVVTAKLWSPSLAAKKKTNIRFLKACRTQTHRAMFEQLKILEMDMFGNVCAMCAHIESILQFNRIPELVWLRRQICSRFHVIKQTWTNNSDGFLYSVMLLWFVMLVVVLVISAEARTNRAAWWSHQNTQGANAPTCRKV